MSDEETSIAGGSGVARHGAGATADGMSGTLIERVGFEEAMEETWSCSKQEFSVRSMTQGQCFVSF